MRIRSPDYPSISLRKAVDIVDRIFQVSRQNTVDREAAAKDIGYSGLTGQSQKMLANLGHYNLVEKSGKGGIRVTETAVKILHPKNADEKRTALNQAAYAPDLFREIKDNWPDGYVSENALRGHLLRGGFSTVAVGPAISGYMETYGFLQQEGATESHGDASPPEQNADEGATDAVVPGVESRSLAIVAPTSSAVAPAAPPERQIVGYKTMENERVVFVEEVNPAQYLKLVASGDLDETLLEALEDYVKRQKKRLAAPKTPSVN